MIMCCESCLDLNGWASDKTLGDDECQLCNEWGLVERVSVMENGLVSLIKEANNLALIEIQEDYRRHAITLDERDDLLSQVRNAKTLRAAQDIVYNHRRNR